MNNIFLQSDNLILEPLESKHQNENYVSWLNDEEVTKYNSHGIFPNTLAQTEIYVANAQTSSSIVLAIIHKKANKHIGNVAISSIDFINSHADLVILIGDKNYWNKGYAYESFTLLIKHCFNKLNLHKVTAGTTSDHIGMQKVLEKLNMTKEATIREAIQRDGNFYDIYRYGLLKKEYTQALALDL